MKLTVLGTGSPLPIPNRVQTGYLLEHGDQLLSIDCGSGVYDRLRELKVDWEAMDTYLITHHHLDHMTDLLTILLARWLMGCKPATVYGPVGTKELVTQWMKLFEYVHQFVEVDIHDVKGGETLDLKGFHIETMEMNHFVTSLSYKFDGKLAICGDSDPIPELKPFADGCEVLIHECSYTDDQADNGHANPSDLGKVLKGSTLKQLWLTHFYPKAAEPQHLKELVDAVQQYFSGQVVLAEDLQTVEL